MSLEVLDFIVKSIVESNANINQPDAIMNWYWSEYVQSELFNVVHGYGKMEIVRVYMQFLRRKIQHNNCSSPIFLAEDFCSIFLWALKVSAMDMISDLVLLELTPVQVASIFGNVSVIKHLIEVGGNISTADMFGCTPLHYSIMRCSMLRVEKMYLPIYQKNKNTRLLSYY